MSFRGNLNDSFRNMNTSFRNMNTNVRKFVSNEQWDEWMQSAETQEQDPTTWLPTLASRKKNDGDGEMELTDMGYEKKSNGRYDEY